MQVLHKIRIDMLDPGLLPKIDAVQNDANSRAIAISLYSGDDAWNIPNGASLSVGFRKADGTSGLYDTLPDGTSAINVADNVVTIILAPQVLTVPGIVLVAVRIENSTQNNQNISAFPFKIRVFEDPANNAVESENYYKVQNWEEINAEVEKIWGSLGGAVLYTSQNLTPEQQTQARENIGMGGLAVMIAPDKADHTPAEIMAHLGGPVIGVYGLNLMMLSGFTEEVTSDGTLDYAHFRTATDAEGAWTECIIDPTGAVTVQQYKTGGDAILYTAQTLAKEQKAQARENIGAADANKVREIDETLNGTEPETITGTKYIDGETCMGYASAGSTIWTELRHELIIVPVKGGDVVEIAASDTKDTYLYFLKSYTEPVVGETIDFTAIRAPYEIEAEGKSGTLASNSRCHVAAGKTYKLTVPEDTTCILVYNVCKSVKVNGNEAPVVVNEGTPGLVDEVNEHGERIGALEKAVDRALTDAASGESEKTTINIDNPYVRAYLMNTQYSTDEWDTTNGHPYFTREDVSAYSQYVQGGKDKATPFIVNIEPHDGALSYKIVVSENPGYTNAKELTATTGENKITWLKINRVYWIKTVATTTDGEVVLTEKTIETHGVRRLNPLTSVQNMRDLGGQTTVDGKVLKQGLLYRCASLANITPEDVSLLENVLDIKLVVGLANNTEDDTKFSANVETFNPINLSHYDNLNYATTRPEVITYLRKIIEYLSQGKAVLFHCNAGADRTGLMAATIEGLCGVSENDICKDYELTSFAVYSDANQKMTSRTRLGEKQADGTYRHLGFDGTIWYVRQQGGCETYADQWKKTYQASAISDNGVEPLTDAEIEALRKALIVEK